MSTASQIDELVGLAEADAAILIVDDHIANLVALEAVLEPLGRPIVRASSGEEALRHILDHEFAVVLLDVMMPGLDGFETAALIRGRKRSSATPLIFLSARNREHTDVIKGYAEGAVDYLVKPFDPTILRAKVKVFVELHLGRIAIRRQAQELREKERQLQDAERIAALAREESIRQIVESISDPMLIVDRVWRIEYVNAEGATMIGRPREELLGAELWSAFPEAPELREPAQRARDDHAAISFEIFVPTVAEWYEVKAYPTRDDRLSIHFRRITARKNADAALAREVHHAALRADISNALAYAQTLAEMLQDSVEAIVKWLDGAFARVWTLNADVLELQASAGMYTHLDGPHGRVPVGKFKIGRIAERLEPHLTNDVAHDSEIGDPPWAAQTGMVAFAGYPLIVDGACIGVVAMFARSVLRDDTVAALASVADSLAQGIQRKRAEQALDARAQELARSNAELERFAYVASHDLQEPLRMVASYTQLLSRRYKGKLDPTADEFIGFAVDGANRMQGLINDLLTFSRIGTQSQPPVATSLEAPFAVALANLKTAIDETGATITHDPLPSLPIDQHQFVQLFQNLIGNAIKFRGVAPPAIHVGVKASVNEWELSVRDNGIGIAEEYFERLFVLFQRLHTRKEYPGNGIGLAICKKVVERHGGRVWVESTENQGTTFFLTLKGTE